MGAIGLYQKEQMLILPAPMICRKEATRGVAFGVVEVETTLE
jgi:hypothetical protein